jgi:hypothetical protein
MEQRFLAAAAKGDALHHFDITDLGVMEQGAEAVVAALFSEGMRAPNDEDFGTLTRYSECSLRLQDHHSAYAGPGRLAFTQWATLRQYSELQRSKRDAVLPGLFRRDDSHVHARERPN